MSIVTNLSSDILREVGLLSRSVHAIIDVQSRQALKRGQFIFLARICENEGINLVSLSNLLKVDKATTTKAVQKLIEEGYLVKERDKNDKRMWRLLATEKGKELYPALLARENENIAVCFASFNEQEKVVVAELIARMRKNIEMDWKKIVARETRV